jgi:hypothetical protein
MHARTAASVVTLAASLALVSCRNTADRAATPPDSAAVAAAAPASSAVPAGVVTVTARDFAFEAPAEIPAGWTTFRLVNDGPSLHHMQLIRLEDGKTAADYLASLKAGGPPVPWAIPAGGPNPPEPGSSSMATVPLTPGSYLIVCFVPGADGVPHVMKGMMHPFSVTASTQPEAPEPTADVAVKLLDYGFEVTPALTSGHHVLRIENAGPQPHELAIVRLEPGKQPVDFGAWGEKPTGAAPGKMYGGVSAIMPGTHAFATVDLPPGDYGLICFVPDAKDGKPHFRHGMVKRITVS